MRAASVFAALGDPTRLNLMRRLSMEGPLSITRLSDGSGMSRQAVTKHLRSLGKVGLVRDKAAGREHVFALDLKRLAEETGGGFFYLEDTASLGPTFSRVAQELHSQYLVGFSPAAMDGKVHKLETRVTKPGLTVRARKSYVAKSS